MQSTESVPYHVPATQNIAWQEAQISISTACHAIPEDSVFLHLADRLKAASSTSFGGGIGAAATRTFPHTVEKAQTAPCCHPAPPMRPP